MGALIELQRVTNRFGPQTVHDRVDLAIEENEILGMVGGSGSGKSVLLRTMLGLNKPAAGKVMVDGEDLYALPPEERMGIQKRWGVLFQNGALFSGLSVLDNVALPLREHTDLAPDEIDTLAFLKLKMVGLDEEAAAKPPAALSGGMTTRAAIARAMALDPTMLFLDEPTGALDPVSAASLDELLTSLQSFLNLTIVIITHDLATLTTICDRIAMIADKKLVIGTLDEMLKSSNPAVKEFFGGPRMAAMRPQLRKRK
jgi:phospholipid/cholesterol/gamma-HCH transport system ATP-binding protein